MGLILNSLGYGRNSCRLDAYSQAATRATAALGQTISRRQIRAAVDAGFIESIGFTPAGMRRPRVGVDGSSFLEGFRAYLGQCKHQGKPGGSIAAAEPSATSPTSSGGEDPDLPPVGISKARQEHWKAVRLELEQRERMKGLCRLADVEAARQMWRRCGS